jgi:hypothetical protein
VVPAALAAHTLVLRVHATPSRSTSSRCAFVLSAPVVGGGTQRTCLTSVDGYPAPHGRTTATGTMTFELARGTLRVRVRVVQRFGPDGVHASQSVTGTVDGGTGRFRGAQGTLRGSGTVADRASRIGAVDLHYLVELR